MIAPTPTISFLSHIHFSRGIADGSFSGDGGGEATLSSSVTSIAALWIMVGPTRQILSIDQLQVDLEKSSIWQLFFGRHGDSLVTFE
jgi:hypothetical protein